VTVARQLRVPLRLLPVLIAAWLGYYNRRDLLKHWIRKEQRVNQPCDRACCRHMRLHPEHYPVILPDRTLHRASDKDLMQHWSKVQGDSGKDERARAQLLAEMQRRDELQERREQTEERRRQRWTARRIERQESIEREWLAAEQATKGVMLNRRGKEAKVNERTLFIGPESRARKYASEELLNYWESHPRPTGAYFEGYDTRLGYANTGVRRRITSEEAAWRDAYERAAYNIEHGLAA
jgi:hypothetical protein